jgi:hypothetical protein
VQLVAAGESSDDVADAEPDTESGEATETADAAVMAVLKGLSANQPDAVWDALPQSYRRNVSDLVSRFACRLHPEAWRWFSQIAAKSRTLLPEDGAHDASRESAARLLEWLASGSRADLEELQHPDLGRILQTHGPRLMADLRAVVAPLVIDPEFNAALHDIAGPLPEVLLDPSLLQMTVKSTDGDRCILEIQLPVSSEVLADLYRFEVEFARVDGKWIPQWLADNWADMVAMARDTIETMLPSERAEENFGIVFRYLAQLDAMIEFELAAARGEQAVEPSLYDIVDFLLGVAEDFGVPLPDALRGGEIDAPPESMEDGSRISDPEGKNVDE